MVEGARLESVCTSNGTAGSNPVLSAMKNTLIIWLVYFSWMPGEVERSLVLSVKFATLNSE